MFRFKLVVLDTLDCLSITPPAEPQVPIETLARALRDFIRKKGAPGTSEDSQFFPSMQPEYFFISCDHGMAEFDHYYRRYGYRDQISLSGGIKQLVAASGHLGLRWLPSDTNLKSAAAIAFDATATGAKCCGESKSEYLQHEKFWCNLCGKLKR